MQTHAFMHASVHSESQLRIITVQANIHVLTLIYLVLNFILKSESILVHYCFLQIEISLIWNHISIFKPLQVSLGDILIKTGNVCFIQIKKQCDHVIWTLESKQIDYTPVDISDPNRREEREFMKEKVNEGGKVIPPQIFNDEDYIGVSQTPSVRILWNALPQCILCAYKFVTFERDLSLAPPYTAFLH